MSQLSKETKPNSKWYSSNHNLNNRGHKVNKSIKWTSNLLIYPKTSNPLLNSIICYSSNSSKRLMPISSSTLGNWASSNSSNKSIHRANSSSINKLSISRLTLCSRNRFNQRWLREERAQGIDDFRSMHRVKSSLLILVQIKSLGHFSTFKIHPVI